MATVKSTSNVDVTSFKFKTSYAETGLLLKVQHTETVDGKINRVPFKWIGFNKDSNRFVTIGSRKDIYVFDLNAQIYWYFDEAAKNCSCFSFELCESAILVGSKYGSIFTVQLGTGKIEQRLKVFEDRVIDIVVIPPPCNGLFLCYSSKEASICKHSSDIHNGQLCIVKRFFKVATIKTILSNLTIQKIAIRSKSSTNPSADKIFTFVILVNDDSLYIYDDVRLSEENAHGDHDNGVRSNAVSFQLTKHIHPIEMRDLHGRDLKNYRINDPNNNDAGKPQSIHSSTNLITDMNFNENGTELWISCKDSSLILIGTNDWYVTRCVSPEEYPITQFKMLSTTEIPSTYRKSLANLSIGQTDTTDKLSFLAECTRTGTINVQLFTPWKCSTIKRFTCSPDSKLLAVIQTDGTLKLYSMEFLVRQAFQMIFKPEPSEIDQTCSMITDNLNEFDANVDRILSRQRLLAILHEYGEYPSKYREIIWKYLLKLPNNTLTFCQLRENAPHNCVESYTSAYQIPDRKVRRNFDQILSALINWSQILRHSFHDEDHFLPYFIYPFVKCMGGNLLQCFEMIATILLNQCGLWFEFSPLLPANYLGLIENLIDHHAPELIAFYHHHSVDSRIFAWPLMRTAFTDILAEFQWFMLWDHIVSQPAHFPIFIIVAFNCMQLDAIKRLKTSTEIRAFFNEPTTINMKLWLRKSYELMNACPPHLHPKQYIEQFIGLDRNQNHYHKILNYPADQYKRQSHLTQKIQKNRASINRRYAELEQMEMELMQQIVNTIEMNVQRERQHNVKLAHERAVIDATASMENQRQQLILTERQLSNREALIKILNNDMANQRVTETNTFDWQMALHGLERLKLQDETELLAAESSLRKRDIDLLLNECNL